MIDPGNGADRLREGSASTGPLAKALARAIVRAPHRFALYLDLDGTLLDIAATPDAVTTPAGLCHDLKALAAAFGGSLAIISGRSLADVDRLLAPLVLPGSGVHGSEIRHVGRQAPASLAPPIDADLAAAVTRIASETPGLKAEIKGAGIALHYRERPAEAPRLVAALRVLLAGQGYDRYEVRPGCRVLEILPRGLSKGTALASLSATAPFRGRIPLMIGDDLGDEPAFRAAEALQGYALRVAGEAIPLHTADFPSPAAVRTWLGALRPSGRYPSGQ